MVAAPGARGRLGLLFAQLSLNSNIEQVAINCLIYAILAVGLNIAVGWAGLLDLGYIAFFGFGAYGYAVLSSGTIHWSAIASIPVGVRRAGRDLRRGHRPGRRCGSRATTWRSSRCSSARRSWRSSTTSTPGTLGGVNGLFGLDPHPRLRRTRSPPRKGYYYFALVVLAVLMGLLHFLDTSRTGRAWRAVREDELAAEAMTRPHRRAEGHGHQLRRGRRARWPARSSPPSRQTSFPPTSRPTSSSSSTPAWCWAAPARSPGAVLGGIVVTAGQQMVSSPTDAGYLFYGLILLGLVAKVRPWRVLGLVIAGTVVARARAARDRRRHLAVGDRRHARRSPTARWRRRSRAGPPRRPPSRRSRAPAPATAAP